jgi:hypothetical protein
MCSYSRVFLLWGSLFVEDKKVTPKRTFIGAVFLLIPVFSIPALGVDHHAGMFRYPDVLWDVGSVGRARFSWGVIQPGGY